MSQKEKAKVVESESYHKTHIAVYLIFGCIVLAITMFTFYKFVTALGETTVSHESVIWLGYTGILGFIAIFLFTMALFSYTVILNIRIKKLKEKS